MGPGTLAIVGTAASVIGTGVLVYGGMQQSAAQQKAANYQAQVAQNNAIVAQQNATAVQNQAAAKAQEAERAGAARLSAQRVALATNGGTLDSGSALDVQDATATNTALAAQDVDYQGRLAAYGYVNQGNNFSAQSNLDRMQADSAAAAAPFQAAGGILSGASQVASKWSSYQLATQGYNSQGMTQQMGGFY